MEGVLKYPDLKEELRNSVFVSKEIKEKAEAQWRPVVQEIKTGEEDREKKIQRLYEDSMGIINVEDRLLEEAVKHPTPYPVDWYTPEEALTFVQEHMYSKHGNSKEVDEYLARINREFPETLDYYRFPKEWEENGVALKIREHFHVTQAWDNRYHTVKELILDDDDLYDEQCHLVWTS